MNSKNVEMQTAAKAFVRKVTLSVIVDALTPAPVWRHLLIIAMLWSAYGMLQLPGFTDDLPFTLDLNTFYWLTIGSTSIAYLTASCKNFCAPVLAFVISVVMIFAGLKLEGIILNLYCYAGIIIGFPFRRV